MSLRKTLILGLILLGFFGYLQWVELPKEQAQEVSLHPLKDLQADAIELVEISDREGSFSFKNTAPVTVPAAQQTPAPSAGAKDFATWELGAVPGAKLDPVPLRDLVSSLTTLELGEPLPAGEVASDKKIYGLDVPALKVRVVSGGTAEIFSFGKMNEYLRKRYLTRNGGDALYLVTEDLFRAASKRVDDFRKRTPVEFVDADIASVAISGAGLGEARPDVELVVNDTYQWRVVKPGSYRASDRAVAEMTRQLRQLRAVSFVDDAARPAADFGLEKPYVTVELKFKSAPERAPLVVSIGKAESKDAGVKYWMALSGHPSRYELSSDPLPNLYKELDVLREKQQLRFATEETKRVTLDVEGQSKVELSRDDTGWKLADKVADGPFVSQFLTDLSELTADRFVRAEKDYGFAKPRLTAAIEFKNEALKPRTLVVGGLVGASDKDGYFAAVDDRSEVFIISPESFKKIARRAETFEPVPTPAAATPVETSSQP